MSPGVGLVTDADGQGAAVVQRDGSRARVRFTDATAGDFGGGIGTDPTWSARTRGLVDAPWSVLRQVHGSDVVVVTEPLVGDPPAADGAVTERWDTPLAVRTADCAPVGLLSRSGPVGIVHAGWRGLAAGVVAEGVARIESLGGTDIVAVVGPTIGPECYEFGADDLALMVERFGAAVAATTATGSPALDVVAAVTRACADAGVTEMVSLARCTACAEDLWSHRRRRDTQRMAGVVWRERA